MNRRGWSLGPPFSFQIGDHQVALIGGRVYCEGCHSIGVIAKAGGPRRANYISEVALEGDICVCQCPNPQPLKSTLQSMSTYDDGFSGGAAVFDAATMLVPGALPLWGGEEMVRHEELQKPDRRNAQFLGGTQKRGISRGLHRRSAQ